MRLANLPADAPAPVCFELSQRFSPEWCRAQIAAAEARSFASMQALYPGDYRNNDRCVRDDAALAAEVYAAVASSLSEFVDGDGQRWRPVGCNPRFRYCRYEGGQAFTRHRDGPFVASASRRTWLTCQIYLNDGFIGGRTRFYAQDQLVRAFVPKTGNAIVFEHSAWHDGEAVTGGRKYVLRTDVIFERIGPGRDLGRTLSCRPHDGYIWAVAAWPQPEGVLVCSAGRDGAVRLWDPSSPDAPPIAELLSGGQGSVTCLAAARDTLWAGTRTGALLALSRAGAPQMVAEHGVAILAMSAADPTQPPTLACADGTLRTGTVVQQAHAGWAWGVAHADASSLLSVGADGQLLLWRDGAVVARYGHPAPLRCVVAQGDRVAVGDAHGRVVLLLCDGAQLHVGAVVEVAPAGKAVISLTMAPDAAIVATDEDGGVSLLPASAQPARLHRHADFATSACVVAGRVVSGGYDAALRVSPRR